MPGPALRASSMASGYVMAKEPAESASIQKTPVLRSGVKGPSAESRMAAGKESVITKEASHFCALFLQAAKAAGCKANAHKK